MRILVGFVFMGMIALVAVVLAAVQLLIQLLPLLLAALLVVAAVRLWERRRASGVARPPAPQQPVIRRPAPQWPPLRPRRAGGWVMVPVWMDAANRSQRHPVIDAEVIGEDGEHRG